MYWLFINLGSRRLLHVSVPESVPGCDSNYLVSEHRSGTFRVFCCAIHQSCWVTLFTCNVIYIAWASLWLTSLWSLVHWHILPYWRSNCFPLSAFLSSEIHCFIWIQVSRTLNSAMVIISLSFRSKCRNDWLTPKRVSISCLSNIQPFTLKE